MLVVRTGWRALCSTVCKWYIALFFSSLGGALVLALILMAVDPDASSTAVCNEKGRDPEEECDFNTDISDSASNADSDAYIDKYEEIVETALEDAERMMNGRGENVQLKMDAINRDFEDLTIDQGDPDVVRNTLNDIEGTINDIKHLIESTRSLLDRVPLEHNAQGFNKSDYVEPHVTVGGFGDSRYHFEVDMNV